MKNNLTQVLEGIMQSSYSREQVQQIIHALKFKNYIHSATLVDKEQDVSVEEFMTRFWDYGKSPYIQEKLAVGQKIHQRYVRTNASRVKNYFLPKYGSKYLSEISKRDIKDFLVDLATNPQKVRTRKKGVYQLRQLKTETVNQIVRAVVCPLKWAYKNELIKNNCFEGIVYCHIDKEKRIIPSTKQASMIFSTEWKNPSYKLANMVAMFTGMRIGEVQALQICDIGSDRIYVRHNWEKLEGLKEPKNGEGREIPIPPELVAQLKEQCRKNPFGQNPTNFVFYSHKPNVPCGCRHWNEALHQVTKKLNIPNNKKITFHCWRHFYTASMADNIDQRKLQQATGHKTLQILELYAAHQREQNIQELAAVSQALFLPIIHPQ